MSDNVCKNCIGSGIVSCSSCTFATYESCEDCDNTVERNAPCQYCCRGFVNEIPNLEGDPILVRINLNDPLDINFDIDDDDEPYFESYPWED